MTRDNDSGYALITVVFILLAAVSAVLLPMAQQIPQARTDAAQYISDMKMQKFKKAFWGRMAEQSGGEAMSCGGLVSDCGLGFWSPKTSFEPTVNTRRYMRTGTTLNQKRWAEDFTYNAVRGFWSGYRGRRYLYPSPADDWDETRIGYFKLTSKISAGIPLPYRDGFGTGGYRYSGSCNSPIVMGIDGSPASVDNSITPFIRPNIVIIVRDYTRTAHDRLDLWFTYTSRGRLAYHGYFLKPGRELDASILTEAYTDTSTRAKGYHTHTFHYFKPTSKQKGSDIYRSGLYKLSIVVDGHTTFTTSVVVSPHNVLGYGEAYVNRGHLFVQEIDYWG